jgi:hypothetical protein
MSSTLSEKFIEIGVMDPFRRFDAARLTGYQQIRIGQQGWHQTGFVSPQLVGQKSLTDLYIPLRITA